MEAQHATRPQRWPVRAVLDPNVIISALLSPIGASARLLLAWQDGRFEIVVSAALLTELEGARAYPKLRRYIAADEAEQVIAWLARTATVAQDPDGPPVIRSADPGDDCLLALAATQDAFLGSGDGHLLALREALPIHAPADFLELLQVRTRGPSAAI